MEKRFFIALEFRERESTTTARLRSNVLVFVYLCFIGLIFTHPCSVRFHYFICLFPFPFPCSRSFLLLTIIQQTINFFMLIETFIARFLHALHKTHELNLLFLLSSSLYILTRCVFTLLIYLLMMNLFLNKNNE